MRIIRPALGMGLVGSLAAFAGALPASAAGTTPLPWHSPNQVTSGVPVAVSSIAPCPSPPTPGDSVLVQINLSFGPGGAGAEILSANPDGSWAGDVTFTFFSGVPRQTTISAECLDFTGFSAAPYAQYQTHHTQLFSS